MNNTTKIQNKTNLILISNLINEGLKNWVKAGELLVKELDDNKLELNDIADAIDMPVGVLAKFEQLGRKQIIPDLLVADYPASSRLLKLPYSEQTRLIEGSVEVLIADDSDSLIVSIKDLTPSQCKQVFSSSSVRNLASQRAWIESNRRKSKKEIIIKEMPYSIQGKEVIFERGCKMKASQLLNILSQLTPKN